MESSSPCRECESIARKLVEAYVEAWESADLQTRQAWRAIRNMRTEQDVSLAEESMSQPRPGFRGPAEPGELMRWLRRLTNSPIMLALRKKDAHESSSGHKVVFPEPF